MSARGSYPPGRAGLIIAAAALVPVVLRKAKPITRAVGNSLIWAGKVINELAEEPKGTAKAGEPPKEQVKPSETKKKGKKAGGVDVTTASPTGQEEMSQHAAAEAQGKSAPPKRVQTKPKTGESGRKKLEPDQPLNPKRTRNSRKS